MEYTKQIIENYKKRANYIQDAMRTEGIFPDRNAPQSLLDIRAELLLKLTFKLRVAFLEEMEFLFAYICSKTTMETLVMDLEKQGYIQSSVSRDLGKYWVLTPVCLYYFYTDRKIAYKDASLPNISLPSSSKLMLYKTINATLSSIVFDDITARLYQRYKAMEREYKQLYQKSQYVEQFVLTDAQKKKSRQEKEALVSQYLATHEISKQSDEHYAFFIRFFKERADTIHLFNFLKGFYSSSHAKDFREQIVTLTRELFFSIPTNIYQDSQLTFRQRLFAISGHSGKIETEGKLFLVEEYLKLFSIAKRSLNNNRLEDKTAEEVSYIKSCLEELDAVIPKYESLKASLVEEFGVMVYDKIGENDVPLFTEQRVTLESLRNSNVYITDAAKQENGKYLLTFTIFQPSFDELSVSYLFSKMEKIFQFCLRNLLMCDYRIVVSVYTEKHREIVRGKLPILREEFSALSQYALFLPVLSQVEVISCERHFKERYEVFREIRKYI